MSTFRSDLFGGVSGLTSTVYLVHDAAEITFQPLVASATTLVVHGSNATGFRVAIAETEWSTLTTARSMTANDMFNIEPGFRWIRCIRESATSLTGAVVAGRNVVGGHG